MENDPIKAARDAAIKKIIAGSEGVDERFAEPLGESPVTGEPIWPSGGIVAGRALREEVEKRQNEEQQ